MQFFTALAPMHQILGQVLPTCIDNILVIHSFHISSD